jgi:hypothetical protein
MVCGLVFSSCGAFVTACAPTNTTTKPVEVIVADACVHHASSDSAAPPRPCGATPTNNSDPDCAGPNHWATNMAFVDLKNAKLVTNDQIDFTKTKAVLIASQQIGPDLWHQVHLVSYQRKDGSTVQAITVSDASREECSLSDVQVFVVSERLPLTRGR